MKERYMYLKVGFKDNGLINAIDDFSIADGGRGSSTFGTPGDQRYGPYFTFGKTSGREWRLSTATGE